MADMWTEAGEEAELGVVGMRYDWMPLPKPWYWVFSFWRERWKNWGRFKPLIPSNAGYDKAQYELTYLMSKDCK